MRERLVCVQQVYNEEYLMPWWIAFHRDLFDHVVFLDHGSTDGTVREIATRAPDWEVRPSAQPDFDAVITDQEIMAIEREHDGWKIVLNTTEFLWAPRLREQLAAVDRGPFAVEIEGKTMVDRRRNRRVDPARPIHEQRPWAANLDSARGRFALKVEACMLRRGHASFWLPKPEFRRRFLHGAPDGQYHAGRHETDLPVRPVSLEATVLWLGYSPWTPEFRRRKLQIGPTISEASRAMHYGFHHDMSAREMELARALLALSSERLDLRPGEP